MSSGPTGRPQSLKRIALVSDWYLPRLGGIEWHVADLAAALSDKGCDVTILTTTPDPSPSSIQRANGAFRIDRIDTLRAPRFGFSISPRLAELLTRRLQAGDFQLVHVHASVISPLALAAVIAARRLNLPAVVTFHSMLLRAAGVLRWADRRWSWSSRPILWTAVSDAVAAQASGALGGAPVQTLSNGVYLENWPERPRPKGAPDRRIVIATAMRLTRKKRPLELLDAFWIARDIASAHGCDLELRIAGEGPLRAKMERMIQSAGAGNSVFLLGALPRNALQELYAGSDIFIMPSTRESFGLAALEARASGLPVVAMAGTGTQDFLIDGKTGLLAQTDRGLASQLARLALDADLRARLSPRDTGIARFNWPKVADRHPEAYEQARILTAP